MIVSGNDVGYSPNTQSTLLAANDVANTWSRSQAAPNEYAIFQDHDPWSSTIVKTAITNAGHGWTTFPFSSLVGFPFSDYRVIVLNFDDHIVTAFDPPYSSVIAALQTYVMNGGVLWIQGAIQNGGALTYPLPFGGTATFSLQYDNYVVDPSDPLVAGLWNPFNGNYASHAHFAGYPGSAHVIVSEGTTAGGPTVLYTYETGVCPPTPTPGVPTATFTRTPSPTRTRTFTHTPTPFLTHTATSTRTSTPTRTATSTATSTSTMTMTSTRTLTATPTPTRTRTLTATATATATATLTLTACGFPGDTCTPTATPDSAFYVSHNLFTPDQQPVSIYVAVDQYPGAYKLMVFNTAGEQVRTLDDRQLTAPHQQSYLWDGKNEKGEPCASGVYLLHLVEPLRRQLKKVLLVR
jgi:hypothetical protein